MTDTENQKQNDRIDALEKGQKEILAILGPISDTYRTVNTLGRWLMAFLVLLSIVFGTVANWVTIKSWFGK